MIDSQLRPYRSHGATGGDRWAKPAEAEALQWCHLASGWRSPRLISVSAGNLNPPDYLIGFKAVVILRSRGGPHGRYLVVIAVSIDTGAT